MHILLIHQAFIALDEAGGTRHIEMARYLATQGHQVTIITGTTSYLTGIERRPGMRWKETRTLEPGITLIHSWSYAALHRGFFQRLVSFFSFMLSSFLAGLGVRKVDVVWGTSPPIFQAFTAWLLAFLKRKPFLFEVRDLWPDFAVAMGVLRNRVLIGLSYWLERFLYRRAKRVVVNSPGFIHHVRAKGARRIDLVPNGVDAEMFNPQSGNVIEATKSRLGLEEKFVIMYAGAHGPSNDLGVLLEAAEILQEQAPIHFLFVGDGKDKPALQRVAEIKNLQNVSFIPPIPKSEIKHLFAAVDACAAILKPLEMYKTTYPNKVFDYMAAGKPVLLAIDGVIREVIDQSGAGIFAQPGDARAVAQAALYLYRHPQIRQEMGAAGLSHVLEHFNRAKFTSDFEKILMDIG